MRHAIRMAGLLLIFLFIHCGGKNHLPRITVHPNGHYLMSEGRPFFLLGDAARNLFTQFDDKQATSFLKDRRGKDCNVILIMLAPDPTKADHEGRRPFTDNDPLKPNDAYFAHLSRCIEQAARENLYVCLILGGPSPDDPVYKRISSPEKAYDFGHRIAVRLKKNSNIIWVLGQDCSGKEIDLWRSMAEGVTDVLSGAEKYDGISESGVACVTFYPPPGYSSSYWLQSETWLDFNIFKPEYSRNGRSSADSLAWRDWYRLPVKPAVNIANWKNVSDWLTEDQVREAGYRSIFAGGCGIGLDGGIIESGSLQAVLARPKSESLRFLKNLMLSRPYFNRVPDPEMVVMDLTFSPSATRDSSGHYAFVYFNGPGITEQVLAGRLSGRRLRAWWYSPLDGKIHDVNGRVSGRPFAEIEKADWMFKSPDSGRDWVLVLDDASLSFPIPGEPLNEQISK
jgi:hypothetical protein